MTNTITITEKRNDNAVRIEVDSTIYNEDTMYQDVTIDTYIANLKLEKLKQQLFDICKPN